MRSGRLSLLQYLLSANSVCISYFYFVYCIVSVCCLFVLFIAYVFTVAYITVLLPVGVIKDDDDGGKLPPIPSGGATASSIHSGA